MRGFNFDLIPSDAVGVMSRLNNNPLMNINTDIQIWIYDISSKNDNEMVLDQRETSTLGANTYLGAIVSADRQTIYWVNNTSPLP